MTSLKPKVKKKYSPCPSKSIFLDLGVSRWFLLRCVSLLLLILFNPVKLFLYGIGDQYLYQITIRITNPDIFKRLKAYEKLRDFTGRHSQNKILYGYVIPDTLPTLKSIALRVQLKLNSNSLRPSPLFLAGLSVDYIFLPFSTSPRQWLKYPG